MHDNPCQYLQEENENEQAAATTCSVMEVSGSSRTLKDGLHLGDVRIPPTLVVSQFHLGERD